MWKYTFYSCKKFHIQRNHHVLCALHLFLHGHCLDMQQTIEEKKEYLQMRFQKKHYYIKVQMNNDLGNKNL